MARFPDSEQDIEQKLKKARLNREKYSQDVRFYMRKLWHAEDAEHYYQNKLNEILDKKLSSVYK